MAPFLLFIKKIATAFNSNRPNDRFGFKNRKAKQQTFNNPQKKRHPEVPNVSFFYFVVSARSLPLQVKASDKNICCESGLISSSPGSDDLPEPGCAASRPEESATRARTRGAHQP